jgi:non-ribosomal peptide synthetase component E (peptide arylation enzyme)
MVLGDILRRNAKKLPEKRALIFEETTYTFKELDDILIHHRERGEACKGYLLFQY